MRLAIATLAVLATPWADAFTPTCLSIHRGPNSVSRTGSFHSSPSFLRASDFDISIEYDAAAKLAYNEWRDKYNKGPFDESKYPIFRANYEAISIANVVALKNARDSGNLDAVNAIELNEYADMTEEEFSSMQGGGVVSTKAEASILENAIASSAAQSEAAMAIEEAAAALAEDEQLLLEQLGLESVEELEVAIDSIEGIAEDGGELDTTNISREARIRSAYIEWCKKYSKTPDESRLPTFSSNFLAMEEYAIENSKEMILNKYADCTEQEYISITSGSVPTPEKAEEPASTAAVKAAAEKKIKKESAAKTAKPAEEIKAEVKSVTLETPKPAAAAKKVDEPKAPPKAAETVDVEKMKKLREQELEKASAAAKAAAEAEAIATAKATAEKEAAQIAKRRQFEAEAAEKAREQARKAEAGIEARNAAKPTLSTTKVVEAAEGLTSFLKPSEQLSEKKSSVLESIKVDSPKIPVVEVKTKNLEPPKSVEKAIAKTVLGETSKKPSEPSIDLDISDSVTEAFTSFFGAKASKSEPSVKKIEPTLKPEAAAKPKATIPFLSKPETSPSSAAAPATVAVKKEPQPLSIFDFKPSADSAPSAATKKPEPITKTALDISDPVTEAFASFFGAKASKSEPPVKKIESTPKPEAAAKPKATIPFLSKPEPSPSSAAAPATVAVKKEPQPLSIFDFKPSADSAPSTATKKPEPIAESAPTKKDAIFSLFNLKPPSDEKPKVVAKKLEPVVEPEVSTKKESIFSIFSSKPDLNAKVVKPAAVPGLKKDAKKDSLFFSSASSSGTGKVEVLKTPIEKKQPDLSKKTAAVTKPAPTSAEAKKEPIFSFFSKPKTIEKKTEPLPVTPASKKEPFQLFAPKISTPVKASVPPKTSIPLVVKKDSSSAKVAASSTIPSKVESKPTSGNFLKALGSGTISLQPLKKSTASDSASSSSTIPSKVASKPAAGNFLKALGSGTISLQPLKKSTASDSASSSSTDDIPILKSWKRESDGSITGKVSNSKKFRNGEEITTSPVKGVIKSGSVVVTSSGSKYRLM